MRKIVLKAPPNGFAEDKDYAKVVRTTELLPALAAGESVVLDFAAVPDAAQSFVHALIGEAFQRYGDTLLDRVAFSRCSARVRSVIELVIDYSLGGFAEV